MIGSVTSEEEELGQNAALGGFRQDPQTLGQEKPFCTPMPLFPQRSDALDQRIGKGGDLAWQGLRS